MSHPAERVIRDVPDFPKPGIMFKDITPMLADPRALSLSVNLLAQPYRDMGVTRVAGIESRGFVFGVPVAERLGVGFVPVRKAGKLPAKTLSHTYALEYGEGVVEIHDDAAGPGDRVLVVDDLLATGGTAEAAVSLVRRLGAEVVGVAFVIELDFLGGRSKLDGIPVTSLLHY
jgi:adenine phosphoribosyltransferase